MIDVLLSHALRSGVLPLTSRCNFSCVFCSRPNNPRGIAACDVPDLSPDDMSDIDRLAGNRIVIGESATRVNEGEPLCHPNWRHAVQRTVERFPESTVALTTNASLLGPGDADWLADLGVEVTVSLNFMDHDARRRLLGDGDPARTVRAVAQLGEAGVRLGGSIVALPGLTGWDDVSSAIGFLDQCGADLIRVFIPGWTGQASPLIERAAPDEGELIRFIADLRPGIRAAIVSEPPSPDRLEPRIEDVIGGSGADRFGLSPGDVILEIDGRKMGTRTEAARRLHREAREILVSRGETPVRLTSDSRVDVRGAVLYGDLAPAAIKRLARAIRDARRPLVVCSRPGGKLIRGVLAGLGAAHALAVDCPSVTFGGNIEAAGLLTVSDVLRVLSPRRGFDRVILPAIMFGPDGCDLEGRTAGELERVTKVSVQAIT